MHIINALEQGWGTSSLLAHMWSGPAVATAGGNHNPINLQQAKSQADHFVWPANDAMDIQMALGRKECSPEGCSF